MHAYFMSMCQPTSNVLQLLNRIAAKDINGFPAKVRTYYVQHEIMEEDRALTVTGYMQRDVLSESDVDLAAGKPDTSDSTVATALRKVGFSDALAASPVANLSGGWRMRLAIARSMLYSADLLLLDEPTNHLDHAAISWLENYLCTLDGTTIGVVSHDYDFLGVVATDIIHIHDLKLSYYTGGFKEFQRQCPQIVAGMYPAVYIVYVSVNLCLCMC
jgi:elongation factor 3